MLAAVATHDLHSQAPGDDLALVSVSEAIIDGRSGSIVVELPAFRLSLLGRWAEAGAGVFGREKGVWRELIHEVESRIGCSGQLTTDAGAWATEVPFAGRG